jgi:hypothetical protein
MNSTMLIRFTTPPTAAIHLWKAPSTTGLPAAGGHNGAMDTVAEINHPIPLPEGTTTIKAKTIGFGREDSEIVTFTYKVIPKKTSESSEIKPDEGGTVSLDDEAVIEIPPGALTGTGAQEVKIERVESPPAPPSGFKLLSDVFEFTIDGKKSYNFNKKVTITLQL